MVGGPEPSRTQPRLGRLVGGLGIAMVVVALLIQVRGDPPPSTTTTSTSSTTTSPAATSTTQPASTTSSTEPVPTTTVTAPGQTAYDVIVVGDGMGGATAATIAARLGADTLLLSPIGYLGGQAGAAGVSTMDEGGNRFTVP